MKYFLSLITVIFSAVIVSAQFKPTSEADYKGTFSFAVSETNEAFPFLFTVTTEFHKGGKIVETHEEVHERQAPGVERLVKTFIKEGKTTRKYRVSTGFGKVYCSNNGVKWDGPQEFECFGPSMFYGPRTAEKSEFSVSSIRREGQDFKIYREFIIYTSPKVQIKEFKETLATIDARGYFLTVVNTEGTIDTGSTKRTIDLVRRQTWVTSAKFHPVVAPVK